VKIVVTDLTRFNNDEIVCLAGIDLDTKKCVRPMVENNGRLDYLSFDAVKKRNVTPGSILEGDFRPRAQQPDPHTEDHIVNGKIRVAGKCTRLEFEEILNLTSFPTIEAGFGKTPENRLYTEENYLSHSIVTLSIQDPASQFRLTIDDQYGGKKVKAHIIDQSGYRLSWVPVTDMGIFIHLDAITELDPDLSALNNFFWTQTHLYLRIGLGRPWGPSPEKTGCWVQLNGIYSFPNFRKDLRSYE